MLKKITLFFLWVSASTYGQCYSGFNIGEYHVVSIKSDGTLWGWGSSDAGSLGNTNSINPSSFQIGTSTDWLKVSAGAYNTFVIKNNGTLWAMGDGRYGLLGNGSTTTINPTLQQIGTATNWQKISASTQMTIGLKTDGTIWGWGQNDQYEMGNNTCCANQLTPIQIGTANHWVDVETSLGASVFALVIPLVNGVIFACLSGFVTDDISNRFIFAILAASASYIAVPAAMKITVPKANPGLFLPMALAITFPVNITIGMPIYFYIVQHF